MWCNTRNAIKVVFCLFRNILGLVLPVNRNNLWPWDDRENCSILNGNTYWIKMYVFDLRFEGINSKIRIDR